MCPRKVFGELTGLLFCLLVGLSGPVQRRGPTLDGRRTPAQW